MKTHDEFRELAALRVYGELDESERERLERHLSSCAECSVLARDLEAGLGRLVPAQRGDNLPSSWRAGLEAAIVAEPPRVRLPSRWWIAAASFVLGSTLAWSLASSMEHSGPPGSDGAAAAAEPSAFERATPPPRAREGASLPPLAELYLRR